MVALIPKFALGSGQRECHVDLSTSQLRLVDVCSGAGQTFPARALKEEKRGRMTFGNGCLFSNTDWKENGTPYIVIIHIENLDTQRLDDELS